MINQQEHIILEDLKQGSDKALRKVYEENRDKFINFARRYNLPQDDVVDIYQDAYVIFYNNIMSGKIETLTSSISTYLFSVGKYLIFDKMKKNNKKVGSNFDLSIVRDDDKLLETFEIEEQALTHEQELLRKHFSSLGKQCQELLNLFYYRGFTIKDILEQGNYNNENVIKSAKSRCMKTLKERINSN
ncbi:RNA polymerase sigma-70 factor (ECF subfamily) [Lacinutrix venerupis]|uniref:RNA polymerase subunit sigma-24 n=1 Tax=Lacinutrix venerupis TaxID=1486034 RepID=A0AAC9LJN2_9FLAO|nr:sigma-70 family RNA polymerase sigma factor [Lacinutrix venerupis]APX99564.1 RNA polymerase subunit sigma-24 [Lacinutrix venerupis]RLJ61863.1 RNA polymerase sigma-70 factor (ECF subfamily) [Lacinutrix venerupis]